METDSRLDQVESAIGTLKTDVAVLKTQYKHLDEKLDDLHTVVVPMADKIHSIHSQLTLTSKSWKLISVLVGVVVTIVGAAVGMFEFIFSTSGDK